MTDQDWKFAQVFGDKSPIEEVTDVDIVSAIEFNEDGDLVAAGDRGGRVVLFERAKNTKKGALPEYKFYCEFQSHEPEFDYLKSLEIEEKINKIKWLRRPNQAQFLLTTNDKTIKLWKVFAKNVTSTAAAASVPARKPGQLVIPRATSREQVMTAVPRKIFGNAHTYHINSISLNSDGETYLSSDDLRVNLWNLGINEESFNIVDIKPANMEELTEVITSAEFHPQHCNVFMYSSSKGTIKLADMRQSALCDNHAKVFEEEEDPANKSFFSEIISSISDIKFSADGRYILSRDYLTLKIWDIHNDSKPVRTLNIHDHLRSKLCDLYENDCIFDKFECCFSGDGKHCLTGSYHNNFHVFDHEGNSVSIEANKTKRGSAATRHPRGRPRTVNPDTIDFSRKILHVAWHPRDQFVAVAANNNLFTYGCAP